jgi:hypothetical protein
MHAAMGRGRDYYVTREELVETIRERFAIEEVGGWEWSS